MKKRFEANGGVIASSPDIDKHLDAMGAYASALNADIILIRQSVLPAACTMFEEYIHTAQYKKYDMSTQSHTDREIEAKQKILKYYKQYDITELECKYVQVQLNELLRETEVSNCV